MKAYPLDIVEKIKLLRANGRSYTEIQEQVGLQIPKSSLSYICRDIVMPSEYTEGLRLARLQRLVGARKLALLKNKEILATRINNLSLQAEKNIHGANREYFIPLAMLYWAEGGKWPNRSGLYLASSDPVMLKAYIFLINKCFGIDVSKLHARVQIRCDQSEVECIEYWSKELGINESRFYPAYRDKRTLNKPTKRVDYRGVCGITCAGADIQIELQQMTAIITDTWGISSVG
jgi:hypothetical protein